MLISAEKINKSYGDLQVLRDVSLSISKGEIVSVVGASGAGKTTLLHIIGSLDRPDTGEIILNGTSIFSLNDKKLSKFRNRHIGFIFQFHHLLPEFTALENVALPSLIAGTEKKEAFGIAAELLAQLGLENRTEHKPNALSGGEQQRVAVARALINKPDIILADEPSGNLDSANAKDLHRMFFDLRDKFNQTMLIITHNEELAAMADRKIIMKDGRIIG